MIMTLKTTKNVLWALRSFQNRHQTFHDQCLEKIGHFRKKKNRPLVHQDVYIRKIWDRPQPRKAGHNVTAIIDARGVLNTSNIGAMFTLHMSDAAQTQLGSFLGDIDEVVQEPFLVACNYYAP